MLRFVAPLLIAALALAGCTEWVQRGISPQQRDRELAACKADGFRKVPVAEVVVTNASYYEFSREVCHTQKNRKTGEKYKRCDYTPGYWTPSTESVVDANSDARDAMEDDCMYRRGYIKK
jgi:hypothetical protein